MPRSPENMRRYRAEQYDLYKQLCSREGIEPQLTRWCQHFSDLKRGDGFRRLTREQLQCWWTERFTRREIREMASALDFLLKERG